ncbi:MAG: formylmethanofuran dehydrogenase subunit E family protein [Peptococcaceae bacterium]|nr:formylmethanofuran dehydrogenase subunit E family protein [Peptococcaceae bacterium]
MDIRNIISKIQHDQITIIQEEVPVQFDNRQQTPLGFQWRNRHYEVLKPILVSNKPKGHPGYLILTDGGVFNLTLVREQEAATLCKSKWVLNYRVNDDIPSKTGSDQDMPLLSQGLGSAVLKLREGASSLFVPLPLMNIAHYHGHLCPELAVGYRAGLIAQKELGLTRDTARDFFILAENMSSAIDALQYMTGCTIGNQSFFAYDSGKHVYYFGRFHSGPEPREALRVALINPLINLGHAHDIEKKIMAGQAVSAEVEEYQHAIDKAVSEILNIHEESLFVKSKVSLRSPQVNYSQDYDKCSCCGEVVAVRNAVPGRKGLLCQICVVKML